MDADAKKALVDKIRKCLALARSANEHEATTALAKAQALMLEHGIGLGDVEFDEATARGNGCAARPPRWEMALVSAVRLAIPCQAFLATGYWRFVGRAPSAELAAYAFTVLHRQLKVARSEYVRTRLKRVRPGRRAARADIFCEGWVTVILHKIRAIAPPRLADRELDDYARERFQLVPLQARRPGVSETSSTTYNDYFQGRHAGSSVDLHRPMSAGQDVQLIQAL